MQGRLGQAIAVALVLGLATLAAGWYGYAARVPVLNRPLQDYVFVPSATAPELAVLSAVEDRYIGKVKLPFVPDSVLVAQQIGRMVLISEAQRRVAIYNLYSQTAEHSTELDFVPGSPVISPDGLQLALADAAAGVVGVLDLYSGFVNARTDGLQQPARMAFDGDSTLLFVPDNGAHQITVIDPGDGSLWDPILLPPAVAPAALSALTRTPDGRFGLVSDASTGQVHVIGFRDWGVIKTLDVGPGPGRAYGTSDGQFMLVATDGDAMITVIDTGEFGIKARVPGLRGVTSMATGFFETLAYAVSPAENAAVVIDLGKLENVGRIELPGRPGIAVADVDGKKIYVPLEQSGGLALIDVHKRELALTFARVAEAPRLALLAATNNYCH
jgi:DNA-binding beta-propeller fold protein YncE